jgi:hypothetical protein
MWRRNIVLLLVAVCVFQAYGLAEDGNSAEKNIPNATDRAGRSLHKDCNNIFSAKCIKIYALSFLEDMSSHDEYALLPGLSIVKENLTDTSPTPEQIAAELSRQFPGNSDEKLNRYLMYRLRSYLDGHSLRYKLLDPETAKEAMDMVKGDVSVARKGGGIGGGGGGKGGKGGGSGMLIAAALMMKGEKSLTQIDTLA